MRSLYQRFKRWATWATVEEACEIVPLRLSAIIFRKILPVAVVAILLAAAGTEARSECVGGVCRRPLLGGGPIARATFRPQRLFGSHTVEHSIVTSHTVTHTERHGRPCHGFRPLRRVGAGAVIVTARVATAPVRFFARVKPVRRILSLPVRALSARRDIAAAETRGCNEQDRAPSY